MNSLHGERSNTKNGGRNRTKIEKKRDCQNMHIVSRINKKKQLQKNCGGQTKNEEVYGKFQRDGHYSFVSGKGGKTKKGV